jgi:hypothetical protein
MTLQATGCAGGAWLRLRVCRATGAWHLPPNPFPSF